MNGDLRQLVRVRQQQQASALEVLVQHRRLAEHSAAAVLQAQAAQEDGVAAQVRLCQQAAGAALVGGLRAEQLRRVGHCHGAMTTHNADAAARHLAALQQHAQRMAQLDGSRQLLHGAAAALHQAEQLLDREQARLRCSEEQRAEAAAEEAALQRWRAARLASGLVPRGR